MMRKLFAILAVASIGVMALAQSGVEGAHGRGTARDARGRLAEFDFEVAKRFDGDRVQLGGRLLFQSMLVHEGRHARVTIRLHELTHLAVNRENRSCTIAGNGVMIVHRGDRNEEIRGHIRASFADRRSPEHPDRPHDLIAVNFSRPDRQLFSFEGGVLRGDLVVFWRTQ